MRKAFLVPGLLVLAVSVVHCGTKAQYDDDDDNGGGSSGKGAKSAGKGGSTSAGVGSGPTSPNAGESGNATTGSGGDTGATGGTTATGGSDAMGGTRSTGGTRATGGTGAAAGGTLNEAGAAGESGNTGTVGGSGGSSGNGGSGGSSGNGGSGGSSGGKGGSGGAGAGGKGGAGAGGKGGSSGTGGSSAHGGMSGSGGGGITCGPGLGLALTTEAGAVQGSGWIDGSTDCVGIQGAVYADSDQVGSYASVTASDGHICVSGLSEKVASGRYDVYWGSRINIQLNNPGNDTAELYNASTYGVTGFAFTISGTLPPSIIRPTLQANGTSVQYCESVCASGEQSLLITDAESSCYDPVTHTTPDPTKLTLLQFYLPSNPTSTVEYDFCIDDLRVLTTSTHVGDPGVCPTAPAGNSCVDHCGGASEDGTCYCDSACGTYGDCCSDHATACP